MGEKKNEKKDQSLGQKSQRVVFVPEDVNKNGKSDSQDDQRNGKDRTVGGSDLENLQADQNESEKKQKDTEMYKDKRRLERKTKDIQVGMENKPSEDFL